MTTLLTHTLMGAAALLRNSRKQTAPNTSYVCRGAVMLRASLMLLVGIGMLIAFSTQTRAQSITSGDVTGIVTDPSGAAIPDSAVTLTNAATNTSLRATTNGDGNYRFAFVTPGTYKLEASASGFQNQAHAGIIVTAGQPTSLNIQLTVAGAS